MADSIVRLKVEDNSFNAKIKEAAKSFADFGKRVASAGVEAMGDFAKGVKTAKAAFEGFNAALKANALVLVASLAVQAASALGEMIGDWITGADDAADAQQRLNDKLEDTARLVDSINSEGDFNARIAKAAGKSTSEILQMKVDSAREANNAALATLMDNDVKAGTEEYEKAKKIYDQTQKRLQKALQDQKVDETAKQYRTGEYAVKGGGGRKTTIKEDKDDFEEIIGLIPNAEEAVKSIQEQIRTSWDEGEIEKLTKDLKDAERELSRLKSIGKPLENVIGLSGLNEKTISAYSGMMKDAVSKLDYGSVDFASAFANMIDSQTLGNLLSETFKQGLDITKMELADGTTVHDLWDDIVGGGNISDTVWVELEDKINAKLKELNIEPIKINLQTGNIEQISKDAKVVKGSFKDAASAVGSLGSALSGLDDPGAKIAGTIAQAIANIALAFSSADLKEGESGNIWYWIAATAAGMATMISTIASIHSATGYAQGGMIKGNSYSGDNIGGIVDGNQFVGLNAGEIVLTRAMQGNLASQLNAQGGGRINVVGELQGEKIVLVANRYFKRTGQGEIVTW